MGFNKFAAQIKAQFDKMTEHDLFVVDSSKDELWDTYMSAFPAGTNEIYRERREYDCNHCRNFIKKAGNVVAIIDGKMVSIWDVVAEGYYQDVTDAMSEYVKNKNIKNIFLHNEGHIGHFSNVELLEDKSTKTWHHFNAKVPDRFYERDIATKRGKAESFHGVFKRGLDTLTINSLEMVLELIEQDSIYRGAEYKSKIVEFLKMKREYEKLTTESEKINYSWLHRTSPAAGLRNIVIGTLVQDLDAGKDLEVAVKSFEDKMSGTNYKRTKSLVTKGMIDTAVKKIDALGYNDSLQRRFAKIEDVSVNNVLFVDRASSALMKDSLTDLLMENVATPTKSFDKVEEIGINDFITNVLPHAESLELLVKNSHMSNLASIIAPANPDAPNILQWENNFSWGYNGDITDSMKQRVKTAGGAVDGILRFSIQWNDDGNDGSNDLDAHCQTPKGLIYYSNRNNAGGKLDVDITRPKQQCKDGVAVENIIWSSLNSMPDGNYKFRINNFSGHNTNGFSAEIEFDGQVHSFNKSNSLSGTIDVATVTKKDGKLTIKTHMESQSAVKTEWGVTTEQFRKVSTMMLSPNYWDGQEKGNKHFFFMLEGCVNPDNARGLYTEFLNGALTAHRKVFELLGSKMKCEATDQQLSGLGFSSTQRNEIICKVTGKVTRALKIKF